MRVKHEAGLGLPSVGTWTTASMRVLYSLDNKNVIYLKMRSGIV